MEYAITVKNLSKTYEYHKSEPGIKNTIKNLFHRKTEYIHAVNSISFDIKAGEFIGFIGPNGAGKTTTLKMLSGILYPSGGDITVLGHTPWKREKNLQKQFALVMGQKNQLWWDLTPLDSFELFREMYELHEKHFQKNLEYLSELLGIHDILNIQVRKLSLGQRMKCELAAALLHEPKLLFLDEPTIGLDVVSQKAIRDFLAIYNREKKATILLTSHYLEDIRRLCKRVMIIDLGKIIYDGSYINLIRKYADTKLLDISLRNQVEKSKLTRYGELISQEGNHIKIAVPRKKIIEMTSKILKELPIDDLSIHEKSMEKIVREIFEHETLNRQKT
ncbi:ATP-binding cassette domain-containing protein [Candidatus Peregrinibacteria bacterium]|nr:ATP-binding cassette domain-containing protein [Candidatus Peregrinibacteria bacterium]